VNQLPIADDKDVQTDQDTRLDIQLTGSDEEDGDVLTFFINQDGYPVNGYLEGIDENGEVTGSDNVVTYTPNVGFFGEDSFSITPVDSEDEFGHVGEISIEVNPVVSENKAPIADAGPDQTVRMGKEASLDGTGSYDPEGETITGEWKKISGPDVELSGAETFQPSFIPPSVDEQTELTFELVVNDGVYSSEPDAATITVQPASSPPDDGTPPPDYSIWIALIAVIVGVAAILGGYAKHKSSTQSRVDVVTQGGIEGY